MKATWIGNIIVGILASVGILALWIWFGAAVPVQFEERVPGMDGASAVLTASGSRSGPDGELTLLDGVPAELKGAWPRFRGENLDNISRDSFLPVPKGDGFKIAWEMDVGEGFASPAILDGRVYLMDYDRENQADVLRCFSLADGKDIWRYSYPVVIKRNHGITRTVPSVNADIVISIGPKCHVTCLDSKSGEKKWSLDLVQAFATEIPPWYAGQNPLIDGNRVILAPGGSALIVAVDSETGETIWETPNPNAWKMTHSSIVPMDFNGKRTYLYCASGGIVGVSAEDGRILWETPEWKIRMANVPSPLLVGDGRIFLSGGYEAGSMMLQLKEEEDRIVPEILYRLKSDRFGSTQHTPILYQNHIYGVRPDGQLVCLDLDGNEKWASSTTYKFGLGPYMIVGSILYVLDDSGLLSRVEATHEEFRLLDQTQIMDGHEAWGPLAYASGRMILRDLTQMVCLEVAAK